MEYEDPLRLKRAYSEGIEVCSGMLKALVSYHESRGLPLPRRIQTLMLALMKEVETDLPLRLGHVPRLNRDDDEPSTYQNLSAVRL